MPEAAAPAPTALNLTQFCLATAYQANQSTFNSVPQMPSTFATVLGMVHDVKAIVQGGARLVPIPTPEAELSAPGLMHAWRDGLGGRCACMWLYEYVASGRVRVAGMQQGKPFSAPSCVWHERCRFDCDGTSIEDAIRLIWGSARRDSCLSPLMPDGGSCTSDSKVATMRGTSRAMGRMITFSIITQIRILTHTPHTPHTQVQVKCLPPWQLLPRRERR